MTLTPHPLLVLLSRKNRAIPLLPLWAVRPVQSLSACRRVRFTLLLCHGVIVPLNATTASHPRTKYTTSSSLTNLARLRCIWHYSWHEFVRQGDQIRKEMGGAGRTYGKRGEVHAGFWWGNLRERDHLEDPAVDGTILIWICRKRDEGMDWINLTQNSV